MKYALAIAAAAASCAPTAPPVHVRAVALPALGPALAGNFDVQIALQHIEIARAGVTQLSGARLPEVALAASAGVHRYGRYTMDGAGNASTEITPGQPVPTYLPDLFVGLQASWEADVWGRLGALQGVARARYLASIEGTNLVVTNVVADIAAAYYELAALDRRQQVLTETIAHQTQALEMMRVEKAAGRANELAVRQFEAELANMRALSAATLEQTRNVEGQMNLLLARPAGPIARDPGVLQREVAPIAAGVPSELLHNRPDIRAAELAVAAARLDVKAARAAVYPHLRISAELGYEAFDPRFLLRTPASLVASVVGGLVAPLVNRRGIAGAYRAANATQVEAMVRYQGTVLRGFVDVATGLSALQQSEEIVRHRQERKDALADTVEAANELFRSGKATYLEVLLAQQKTLEA